MSRIAIITRTGDRPELLERCLRSLLAQSYSDWQWIIVNFGCASRLESQLAPYVESLAGRCTILPYSSPAPGMRGLPLNHGLQHSTSELVTVLDDDDTWEPAFLSTLISALDACTLPTVAGMICHTRCIEESSVADGLVARSDWILNADLLNVTLPRLAMVNSFCIHAFIYRRAALEKCGLYPADYPVLEDWHFNLRFLLHWEIGVVPQVLTNYHLRPSVNAGTEANSQHAELDLHKLYEARLINDALREEMETGRTGLGSLLAQAALTRHLGDTLHKHESRLKTISDKTGKIDARTKEMKDRLLGKDN